MDATVGVKSGQPAIEGDEKALPPLVDLIGADVLIWASDFPHFDGHFPGAVTEALEGMATLPERIVRKVLGENASRMYGIPLRRDHAPALGR